VPRDAVEAHAASSKAGWRMNPSTQTFVCSICEEPSTRICVRCTKDTCENHLCSRCQRCSDCCECEVPLDKRASEEPRG